MTPEDEQRVARDCFWAGILVGIAAALLAVVVLGAL